MKRCAHCSLLRPRELFSKNARRPDGLYTVCKLCKRALDRARYLRIRLEEIKRVDRWRRANLARVNAAQNARRAQTR
jgi:hypothetical protein